MRRILLALLLGAAAPAPSAPSPDTVTLPLRWSGDDLDGPGAARLRELVRPAQFVLIGEQHHDRDTPLFARALYGVLRREDGFSHLVVEQDPLGIKMALSPGRRGDPAAIAAALKRWPTLLGFASDQDIALLADAGASVPGPDAIWGVEQAQSPVRYLEELVTLAPDGPVRAETARLLDRARAEDRTRADFSKFLAYDAQTLPDLTALRARWSPPAGRARTLLDALVSSATIYSDYVRGKAEHDPALLYANATVREAWLKARFVERYRAAAGAGAGAGMPRALFKFGDNHARRGVGVTGAWTLGTLAADLATFDGLSACGILVVPIGSAIADWDHLPGELRPLLPGRQPTGAALVDLAALRPTADALLARAPDATREQIRALLWGFNAIVVLPGDAPATWKLTGFPPP